MPVGRGRPDEELPSLPSGMREGAATPGSMVPKAHRAGATVLAMGLAVALTLLVRLPALNLPIEGDSVAYGALARALASGEGYALDGAAHDRYPPLWPAVLAVPVALGVRVTQAARWLSAALAALAAALFVSLASRWPGPKAAPWLVAAAFAVHPALVLFAGGLVPGSEALAVALALASARLSFAQGRGARLGSLALAGLLPLCRYDAAPFAAAALALGWLRARRAKRPRREIALAAVLALLPLVAWCVRNLVVSGAPFGRGYATHGFSIARLPGNLLVLVALVLPVAGLGPCMRWLPRGLATAWGAGGRDRAPARAGLLAAAGHLILVLAFAGPTYAGDGRLGFSSGTLRFGLCAAPFLLLAGLCGIAGAGAASRRLGRRLAWGTVIAAAGVSIVLVSGPLQRRMPIPGRPLAAARLDVFAAALSRAAEVAGPSGAVALDLLPSVNEGLDVFAGDLEPSVRVGTVPPPRAPRGVFPFPPRFDAVAASRERGFVLLTDRDPEDDGSLRGPNYTAGGQGIFLRASFETIGERGEAPMYTLHHVRRP